MPWTVEQVFVMEEASPGTAESVAGADAIHTMRGGTTYRVMGQSATRDIESGNAWAQTRIKDCARHVEFDLSGEVKYGTGATAVSELDVVYQAAGLGETVGAGDVTYALTGSHLIVGGATYGATLIQQLGPASATHPGEQRQVHGARVGDFGLDWNVGSQLMWRGKAVGLYTQPTAITSLTSPTYNAGAPVVCMSAFSVMGVTQSAALLRKLKIDLGLSVITRPSGGNTSTGQYKGPFALGYGGPVTVEVELEALGTGTLNAWDIAEDATASDWTFTFTNGTRTLVITLQDVTIDSPAESQDTTMRIYTIRGQTGYDGTNAPFKLVFS